MLTPTQCQCCSRVRLWVVVDLKRCYRNIQNEWMNWYNWMCIMLPVVSCLWILIWKLSKKLSISFFRDRKTEVQACLDKHKTRPWIARKDFLPCWRSIQSLHSMVEGRSRWPSAVCTWHGRDPSFSDGSILGRWKLHMYRNQRAGNNQRNHQSWHCWLVEGAFTEFNGYSGSKRFL